MRLEKVFVKKNQSWSIEEDLKIRELAAKRMPLSEISRILKRTYHSVRNRFIKLNIKIYSDIKEKYVHRNLDPSLNNKNFYSKVGYKEDYEKIPKIDERDTEILKSFCYDRLKLDGYEDWLDTYDREF